MKVCVIETSACVTGCSVCAAAAAIPPVPNPDSFEKTPLATPQRIAAAQTREPVAQALVSMTQTFIDTIIVCSMTGFTIIATGAWMEVDPATGVAYTGAPLTVQAFSTGLPGSWGGYIVSIGLALFAYSTILGWSYYGERNIEYLLGARAIFPYRILFILAAFVGCWVLTLPNAGGFQLVWGFADIMNGLMAFPNLIGLLLLSGVVARETREYFRKF